MNKSTKVKIIHILPRFPHPLIKSISNPLTYFDTEEKRKQYIDISEPPYWVGFFEDDHHVNAAKHILDLTDEFAVECWRPYGNGVDKIYEKEVGEIKHKVFPGFKITIPHIGTLTWSRSMVKEIKREIEKNNVILNVSVGHVWSHIFLFFALAPLKKKIPIVAKHRSSGFKRFIFKQLKPWKRFFKWYYFLFDKIELKSLKYVDYYFTHSLLELSYLRNQINFDRALFHRAGIDFSKVKPATTEEKIALRKKLNLPQDKKILIAQGNFNSRTYGYQNLIHCFKDIKNTSEGDDLALVIIGGYKHEDLYEVGVKAGAIMVERVPNDVFYEYLRASDFFSKAFFSETIIKFGGIGTSTIEALAMGLPVITNNLIHFQGSLDERKQLGLLMETDEALTKSIIQMKNNLHLYNNCRQIAQKYYNLKNSNQILLEKYRELSKQYFG